MVYQGSELFKFLSPVVGLPIDQLNFILAELFAIFLGLLFRKYLKPCPQNTLVRHLVALVFGILLGHFCYGRQMWHLFFQAFVSYCALLFCPRRYVHLFVFVFSMGYLSAIHIYRQIFDYGNYTLDVTGSMMVSVQKLTSLAFAYYDGMRPIEKLNDDQKSQAISERPHIIEFFSYMFNFQGVIVGPLVYYQDYIDFVNGNNILKNKRDTDERISSIIVQPSVKMALFKKLLTCVILAIIFFKVTLVYPVHTNLLPEILEKGILFRFLYYNMSAGSQRVKYYLAWVLAEAVNNASGLGFNGYDQNGRAKWDLVTNVNIFQIETGTSMKSLFDHWNIQTQLWLRRIAYDRLPSSGKTLGVFVLSAFWHGFYPGYYMTFVLGAFLVYAGRGIRRKIRPHFQKNKVTQVFYSIITWIGALFGANFAVASFDLLELKRSVEFYNQWYWCVHIFCVVVALTLPGGSTKKKKIQGEQKTENSDSKKE